MKPRSASALLAAWLLAGCASGSGGYGSASIAVESMPVSVVPRRQMGSVLLEIHARNPGSEGAVPGLAEGVVPDAGGSVMGRRDPGEAADKRPG